MKRKGNSSLTKEEEEKEGKSGMRREKGKIGEGGNRKGSNMRRGKGKTFDARKKKKRKMRGNRNQECEGERRGLDVGGRRGMKEI